MEELAREPIENHYFGNKTAVVAYAEFVFKLYVELKNKLGVCRDGELQVTDLRLKLFTVQRHTKCVAL